MIGPVERTSTWMSCEECEKHIIRSLERTDRFPKNTVHFCTNFEGGKVGCIKTYPKTPKWCPAGN